jgi:hypothetical protein
MANMLRKIVLEDDSFMEDEIFDDYHEVLREIRNAGCPRDYEFRAGEPDAADDRLFTNYGVTGMETFEFED